MVSLDDLKKIEYREGDKTVIAEPIRVVELENKERWLYKIFDEKLKVYTHYNSEKLYIWRGNGAGASAEGRTDISLYVFQYKDEPSHLVTVDMYSGL